MPRIISPLAGKPVLPDQLVDIPRLMTAYLRLAPDAAIAAQRVTFGTSGHRGSAFATGFNEAHVAAITQALCPYRQYTGINGPLFLGIDTHALSQAAGVGSRRGVPVDCRHFQPVLNRTASAIRDRVGVFRPCRMGATPNSFKYGGFLGVKASPSEQGRSDDQ